MQMTIFITGASTGLRNTAAKLFQSKGWNVIATISRINCANAFFSAFNLAKPKANLYYNKGKTIIINLLYYKNL